MDIDANKNKNIELSCEDIEQVPGGDANERRRRIVVYECLWCHRTVKMVDGPRLDRNCQRCGKKMTFVGTAQSLHD